MKGENEVEEEPWFFFELLNEAEKEAAQKGEKQVMIEGAINTRLMCDYIVTCSYVDITLLICMLHDYRRALDEIRKDDISYRSYYQKVFASLEERLSKQIEYDYEAAVEKCRKKRKKEGSSDIGEEGMLLLMKKGRKKPEEAGEKGESDD